MAMEFDGKGNIVDTTSDGVIAVKFYSLEKQIAKLKSQLQQKENIIKEAKEKLNTQLAFTSSYQLNYQSAMSIIEEAKSILDKEVN